MQVNSEDQRRLNLDQLSRKELEVLQWEQEKAYARKILLSPKGSEARSRALRDGYDVLTKILQAKRESAGRRDFGMGYKPHYAELLVSLLRRTGGPLLSKRVFEIGYGSGLVLESAARAGFDVAGIELSSHMREQAIQVLDSEWHDGLLVGDFLSDDLSSQSDCTAIYWNDVLEHLPPDEVEDYVAKIYEMLMPGGVLVTITPSWYARPSDVTRWYRPPRSEAEGLHLREYTLREVGSLLRRGGFKQIAQPLFATARRSFRVGSGLRGLKEAVEPCLEALPFPWTAFLCRALAFDTTVAWKPLDGYRLRTTVSEPPTLARPYAPRKPSKIEVAKEISSDFISETEHGVTLGSLCPSSVPDDDWGTLSIRDPSPVEMNSTSIRHRNESPL